MRYKEECLVCTSKPPITTITANCVLSASASLCIYHVIPLDKKICSTLLQPHKWVYWRPVGGGHEGRLRKIAKIATLKRKMVTLRKTVKLEQKIKIVNFVAVFNPGDKWTKYRYLVNLQRRIGHFRVPFASVSKRVQVRNLSYENQFYSQVHSDANQTHFHMKGFALGLVLKQRHRATRKWPIFLL